MNIARVVLGRLGQALVVIFAVASITFFLVRLAPGDPFATAVENPNVTPEIRDQWRAAYGLDRPLGEQYARYLLALARGDLGWSFTMQRPVREALGRAIPFTLMLTGTALALSLGIGILVALIQAKAPGSAKDRALSGASLLLYSLPEFWLALVLLLVFALGLGIVPAGGAVDPLLHHRLGTWGRFVDIARHMVLPVTTLTLVAAAVVARYQRGALLDVLPEDFIRTARAKGLAENTVLYRHALRNALLPTITLVGLSLPALLTGAVFVEKIFAWPGMGLLAVNAVATRDYAVVTAVVVVAGIGVTLGSLIADVAYAVANPRLRDV